MDCRFEQRQDGSRLIDESVCQFFVEIYEMADINIKKVVLSKYVFLQLSSRGDNQTWTELFSSKTDR